MRCCVTVAVIAGVLTATGTAKGQDAGHALTGRQLYVAACANCHGAEGTGAPKSQVGFAEALPNFSDCSFASREAAQDWFAVVHQGGPVRAFARRMPAFGAALTTEQITRVVHYVRTLCTDASWPRGELNLPRAMATEKAFPEDESVLAMRAVTRRGARSITSTFIHEKRIGPRTQWELAVPFGVAQSSTAARGTRARLGDIAIAIKHVLAHSAEREQILSGGVEAILPTGDADAGFGAGTPILEPFLLAGRTLPSNSFVQAHLGTELPFDRAKADGEMFARLALGTTITEGFGRSWSPIVEFLTARAFPGGSPVELDWIPQLQVSLSRRQHILASVGWRMPITERSRPGQLVAYLLWDWFDGGLRDGW